MYTDAYIMHNRIKGDVDHIFNFTYTSTPGICESMHAFTHPEFVLIIYTPTMKFRYLRLDEIENAL